MMQTEAPHFSIAVVIPLFNHAVYIGDAIASVLSQNDAVDELIVLDDGSTDDGFRIAEAALADRPHSIVRRQSNAGAHEAINRAIAETRSHYIAILNSDDIFERDKLARCRLLLRNDPSIDLIFGGITIMDTAGATITSGITVDWLRRGIAVLDDVGDLRLALMNENFAATTSNMMFSRRLWQRIGGFQSLRYCHDLDFLLSALTVGKVMFDRDMPHIRYRVHGSNTIKEELARVQVEIAAVLAVNLLGESPAYTSNASLKRLHAILTAKELTEIMVVLGQLLKSGLNRVDLYRAIAEPPLRDTLLSLSPATRSELLALRPEKKAAFFGASLFRRTMR